MNWKFWLGIGISVILLFFLFRGVDYNKLWEASSHANLYLWIPAFFIQYLLLFIRALRWQFLMAPIKKIGIYSLFSATTIGFMANNVLPARMGEFVRAYVIGEKEGISKTSSFATIVVERLFDGLSVLFIAIVVFLFMELPKDVETMRGTIKAAAYGVAAIYMLVVIFFYMIMMHKEKAFNIVRRLLRPFPDRLKEEAILLLGSFATGLDILREKKSLVMISAYSLLMWFLSALPVYLITVSFGPHPPFTSALLILVMLAFAVALPSSPGFIGPFHAAVYVGLGFYGIKEEEALGMAIVMHLAGFAPIVVLGFILLWKEKLSFGKIKNAASTSA